MESKHNTNKGDVWHSNAHMADDFLVLSGVSGSECHQTFGIHHAASAEEHFQTLWDHWTLPSGNEPVGSVWKGGEKPRVLIG